jgi:outer membrane lipoprotein LolB
MSAHPRAWLATAILVLLSACATIVPPTATDVATRDTVAEFMLEGRISATDGESAASGRLEWAHTAGTDTWLLFSPLGQIVAQLVATDAGASLRTADGQTVFGSSAEAMLPELLAVPAPVDGLVHWVQAVPRPGARVLSIDGIGRPTRISDTGWIIDYPEYATDSPAAMPRRIDARWGEARIRLVIDSWVVTP